MNHRTFPFAALAAALSSILVLLSPSPGSAQGQFDDVQIESTRLREGIYMLEGAGGNLGLSVGEDGAFLVDDQMAPLTEKILTAVAKHTDKHVKFVLNTHWHGDHTGGNENMGEAGALIVAHESVRRRLSKPQAMTFLDSQREASPPGALPVVTFTEAMTFHWNNEEIRVFHVENAHTDGDVVVHFVNADVVHAGDVFFHTTYGFIDYEHGGSIDGVIEAVGRILSIAGEETKIIPGHGPLATRADLVEYQDQLATVRGRIEKLLRQGKTEDEIVAAKPTAEFDEEYGKGWINPERYVRLVTRGMIARRNGSMPRGGEGGS